MERMPMSELHCVQCGGFITELRFVSYKPVTNGAVAAPVTSGVCACAPPVVFGPPPGYLSSPGFPIPSRPSS
jgi:hypothetical protein